LVTLPNDNSSNYYTTTGTSNGNFFGEEIFVKKIEIEDLDIGDFIVFVKDKVKIVHPITNIIKVEGQIVAFETKGLQNKRKDSVVFPHEIIGKAYKVLEDGSIEADTKSPR
jgi:signal peptidase I